GPRALAGPQKVRLVLPGAPRTPLQVPSASAPTNEAVTWAAFPGSTTTSASEAALRATLLAPLVDATSRFAFNTPGTPNVANSADLNPPLGGSSPVSEINWGPTLSVGTLTKAAKARPLYVMSA